jgi:hypothetical protein
MSTTAGTLLSPAGIATNVGSPPAQRIGLGTISGMDPIMFSMLDWYYDCPTDKGIE